MDDETGPPLSASDFQIIRNAFKKLVVEGAVPEHRWAEHAEQLVRDFTGSLDVDPDMILSIIRK